MLENAFYDLNLEFIRNAIQENQIGDLVIFDKIDHECPVNGFFNFS